MVLAVCAGLQILGTSFVGPDGVEVSGLGLLDCATAPGPGARAVGELVVEPPPGLGLPTLTGYENHAGLTTLGPDARPSGTVRSGVGNGDGARRAWSPASIWGRTCTARCWPATRPWPTSSWPGRRRAPAARRHRERGPADRAAAGRGGRRPLAAVVAAGGSGRPGGGLER